MRVFVLADDLTGGNGTAALLRREGLPSQTHLLATAGDTPPASLNDDGAHVLDLDTRECADAEASRRLSMATAWLPPDADLVTLRIDSTLRGPIAASLNALLTDRRRLAIVVPAFPASGRTTCDGVHMVFQVPVGKTQVARDPHCPVTDSHLGAWIGARLTAPHALLRLCEVRQGPETIAALLATWLQAGIRAVLCDAETDRDIAAIARAALLVRQSHGAAILPADPGPFTAALVRHMLAPRRLAPLVFGIVGSVMQTSRQQMDVVEAGRYAFTLRYAGQIAAALLAAFAQAPPAARALLLRTDTAVLDAATAARLPCVLADVLAGAIDRFPSLRGFLLSGGEIAGHLLDSLGVRTLQMRSEIMPLISLSRIGDGRVKGRWLVTKGGAVGSPSAIAEALGLLYDVLAEHDVSAAHGAAAPAAAPPQPSRQRGAARPLRVPGVTSAG